MERTIDEGQSSYAQPAETGDRDPDENGPRSIGELVAEIVLGLGAHRAMMPLNYVTFGTVGQPARPTVPTLARGREGVHDGVPLNSASLCEQSARPHFAHFGARRMKETIE